MALATVPDSMADFEKCIMGIHEYAPEVKVTGAISNISFQMPSRKYVNLSCMSMAVRAKLNSAILDPCNQDMVAAIYAAEALCGIDRGGRKYNKAHRKGIF